MSDYIEEMPDEEKHSIKQSATFAGSTFVTMGLVDLLAHLGPTGLLVGGLASYVAWRHGPDIYKHLYGQVRGFIPPHDATDEEIDEQSEIQTRKSGRSFMDRALGRYPVVDDQAQEDNVRVAVAPVADPSAIPTAFTLRRQTLEAIKDLNNNRRCVYFGLAATGVVSLPIFDMYHVLDIAKSGRGKSNRFRLGMMQVVVLADTYYLNPLAAPVKVVQDRRELEVWQPIYDRLVNRHAVRDSAEILQVLSGLVQEIDTRSEQEQQRDFSWKKRPVFCFVDELPEINVRCPDATALIDRIGRLGRQFGVFLWIASQTAQVKDIGLTTASQAQFKTLIYGGGDKTSSSRTIGGVTPEQEKALKNNGAGLTLMSADGVDDDVFVRAPLVTNEALFAFLGLPPFRLADWKAKPTQRLDYSDDDLVWGLQQFVSDVPDKGDEKIVSRAKSDLEKVIDAVNERPFAKYREIADIVGFGKDKVGELLKEARERGLISPPQQQG